MLYMFKVYMLVGATVFGLFGSFMLVLLAWSQATDYLRARAVMARIASRSAHEVIVDSRQISRLRHI